MAANLFQPSVNRVVDDNGNPINGAKMYMYLVGTTTPAIWYNDIDGTSPGTNPQVSGSTGIFNPVFLDSDTVYTIELKNSDNSQTIWHLEEVRGFDESQIAGTITELEVAAAAASAAASTAETAAATAATEAAIATTQAAAAATQAGLALTAGTTGNPYPNSAATYLPQGVTAFSLTSGGTGGTHNLIDTLATYSGGTLDFNPVIYFDTDGSGVVINVRMTFKGLYIGAGTPTMPTVTFPGGAGSPAITLTPGFIYASGESYWAQSSDATQILQYGNNAGSVATYPFGGTQTVLYGKAAIDTLSASVATKAAAADVAFIPELSAIEELTSLQTIGRSVTPLTGSNLGAATYVYATPLSHDSFLRRVRVFNIGAATTLYFKVFSKAGDDFTQVGADVLINVPSGTSTLRVGEHFPRTDRAVGLYPGFYVISNRLQYITTAGDSGGYYDSGSGNSSSFTDAAAQTGIQLQIGFDFSYVAFSTEDALALEAQANDLQAQIDSIVTGDELRAFRWARGYTVPLPMPSIMVSPPTITIGTSSAVSAITGAANGTVNVARSDTRLTYSGGTGQSSGESGYYWWGGDWRGGRVRFKHTGRRFEARIKSYYGFGFDVYIDDQLNSSGIFPAGTSQTGNHLVLVDFGADTSVQYAIRVLSQGAGGSGYAVGDEITLAGGTSTTAAVVIVGAVSGGAITTAYVKTKGSYTALPSNAVAQAFTTGSGTGATFNMIWNKTRSTIKERNIELVFGNNVYFGGLNIDTNDSLTPWPLPGGAPMLQIRSDSFGDNGQTDYESGNLFDVMCHELGLWEKHQRVAKGGRGYLAGSPFNTDAVAANAQAPDLILYGLGVNDQLTSQSSSAVQAEVTARVNADHAANPDVLVVVMTGWQHTGTTYRNAIINGALAATDQTRVRYIDLQASSIYLAASTAVPLVSSDGLHPHQEGHFVIGKILAPMVHAAFLNMM